jgi:hypothetical protein
MLACRTVSKATIAFDGNFLYELKAAHWPASPTPLAKLGSSDG